MNLSKLKLDSIQFREYVHNNDLHKVKTLYENCRDKVLVLNNNEIAAYKFLLTNCDSNNRSPLHIVRNIIKE